MGNTSRYGWPYPEVTDPPNTALHIKNALQAQEPTVGALADAVAALPLGIVAQQTYTANGASGNTTELVQDFLPFTLSLTRKYKVTLTGQLFYQNAAYATIRFRVANGGGVPSASAPLVFENNFRSTIASNFEARSIVATFKGSQVAALGLAAGSAAVGVGTFITSGNGGGTWTWQGGVGTKVRQLILEDCGAE
ncbi:hypothetical protein GCM10027258_57950 [Amycolatopsis stemonae]